jgi:hypothetical protein
MPAIGIVAEVAHLRDMVFAMIAVECRRHEGAAGTSRLPLALARLSGRSSSTHSPFRSPPRRLHSKLPKVVDSKDKAAAAATLDDPVLRDAWKKHTSGRSSRSPLIFGQRLGPDD